MEGREDGDDDLDIEVNAEAEDDRGCDCKEAKGALFGEAEAVRVFAALGSVLGIKTTTEGIELSGAVRRRFMTALLPSKPCRAPGKGQGSERPNLDG